MKTHIRSLSVRTIAVFLVMVLASAACGSTSSEEVSVDSSPSSTPMSDLAAVEAWVVSVSEAWAKLGDDTTSLFIEDFSAEIQIDDTVSPWLIWIRGESGLYDSFADKVEDAPTGSGIEVAAATFVAELRSAAESLRLLADELETSPELQGSLSPGAVLSEVVDRELLLSDAVREACFPFQDAVAAVDQNFPLIDCANSGPAPAELSAPTGGPIVVPADFHGEVEPGIYEIAEFARPIRVEFDQPIRIDVFSHDLEFWPIGDWEFIEYYLFWIVAPDELPRPGTPYGPIGETVPFPDDLRTWLVESGLEIVAEGTTQLAEGSAAYWTIEEPNWTLETAGGGLAFADFDGSPTLYPIRHNSTIWQIPHPDGPLVVIAPEKWEIPGAPGIGELTDFVADIVATIVPIDRSGALTTTEPLENAPNEAASSEVEIAALRETLLGLEGAVASEIPPEIPAAVACDEPFFESVIPLAQPITDVGNEDFGIELLEFESEADRDAHFDAIESGDIACKAVGDQTVKAKLLDTESDDVRVYSKSFSNEGDTFEIVVHVTKVGDTGMLTVRSGTLNKIEAALEAIGMG